MEIYFLKINLFILWQFYIYIQYNLIIFAPSSPLPPTLGESVPQTIFSSHLYIYIPLTQVSTASMCLGNIPVATPSKKKDSTSGSFLKCKWLLS